MSSAAADNPSGSPVRPSTAKFRPSPDGVYNRVGGEAVLINMNTNRIYELNETTARLWELLSDGKSLGEIEQTMLQEYEIDPGRLANEITTMLASLEREQLIVPDQQA
jgi:hypothetical protein